MKHVGAWKYMTGMTSNTSTIWLCSVPASLVSCNRLWQALSCSPDGPKDQRFPREDNIHPLLEGNINDSCILI